jgi:hypothetical protein
MKLSRQNSSLLLSAVTGAGIICGTLTAFFVLNPPKAYACTGVLGSLDPTCPGRIFNQGDGDGGGACVQGFPSPTMREFTVTNLNPFLYDFIVDGQVYRLERGQTLNFSKRVQQAAAACTGGSTTGIPAPVVEFDAEVLKDRLSNEKKGTECSILSPVKQKMMSNDSLVSQACQIGLDAALSTRLPRVELTLIL